MKAVFEDCMAMLDLAIERFPWRETPYYADWLAQTYYYVRHSTRLLAAAAARFAHDERSDALHHRFGAHLSEEKKHELLALHDIGALGLSIDDLPERHATRMFYEPQYYKVEHQDPIVLFGYILPLEAMAAGKGRAALAALRESYGSRATTFLSVHAQDDVEHLEKAVAVLDGTSGAQRRLLEVNMHQTAHGYAAILADIARDRGRLGAESA